MRGTFALNPSSGTHFRWMTRCANSWPRVSSLIRCGRKIRLLQALQNWTAKLRSGRSITTSRRLRVSEKQPHPEHADRWADGTVRQGNQAARKHGAYAFEHRGAAALPGD